MNQRTIFAVVILACIVAILWIFALSKVLKSEGRIFTDDVENNGGIQIYRGTTR